MSEGLKSELGNEMLTKMAEENLGMASTRQMLEELRFRGDLAMTVMPTTPRGQDGSWLSSTAGMLLRACEAETLNARRGE